MAHVVVEGIGDIATIADYIDQFSALRYDKIAEVRFKNAAIRYTVNIARRLLEVRDCNADVFDLIHVAVGGELEEDHLKPGSSGLGVGAEKDIGWPGFKGENLVVDPEPIEHHSEKHVEEAYKRKANFYNKEQRSTE
jgi:hypothetical protein